MRLCSLIASGLTAVYPLLVYFGLTRFEPRLLGALLLVILLLRGGGRARTLWHTTPTAERLLLGGMILLSLAIIASNQEMLLRLYPALMSVSVLALFAHSLRHPPTLIERLARLQEPDLPPEGIRYTRKVTQVWCVFLAANSLVALATVFASREVWALWNGLLSYVCMGTLFAGEWLIRQRYKNQPKGT